MWLSAHAAPSGTSDTLIRFDDLSTNTILLKNVTPASLHANDFVVHPGTA